MGDTEDRTLFCGNVGPKITEAILYELFLQMGPLNSVRLPRKDGAHRGFAFIEFKHESAIPYTLNLLQGTKLFGQEINLRSSSTHNSNNSGQRRGGEGNFGSRPRATYQEPTQGRNHHQPMRDQHQSGWNHNQPIRGHQQSGWNHNQPMRGHQQSPRNHHPRDRSHGHRDAPYARDRHQEGRHRRW